MSARTFLFASFLLYSLSPLRADADLEEAETKASDQGRKAVELSSAAITTGDLKRYVNRLASKEFEGRGTGDRGERVATSYLASFFEELDLQPAGDDGSFFQSFTVPDGKELKGSNYLRIELAEPLGLVRELEPVDQIQPLSFSPSGEVASAEVVFGGFGIKTDGYDSFKDIDPKGKWLVVLRGAPKDIKDLQRFGSLVAKAQTAKEVGAAGLIYVKASHPDVTRELMPVEINVGAGEDLLPAFTISNRLASALLTGQRDGENLEAIFKAHYEGGEIHSFPLPYQMSAEVNLKPKSLQARNVLARLQVGESPSEETIVIGGHIDHLGYGNRGGSRAKEDEANQLHLGADDNASGVAAIMELAQFYADHKKDGSLSLKRDLIFAGWSGEEMGLHGSRYYVNSVANGEGEERTAYPTVSAYINLDMVGRLADNPLKVQATGSSPEWKGVLDGIESDLKTQRSANPYLPTDSSPFYSARVPVLALFTGVHDDYHTPADTVDKIDFAGLTEISRYLKALTTATANLEEPPKYMKVERVRNQSRVLLGIRMEEVADEGGIKVAQVVPESRAEEAGIKSGDIITSLNDKGVKNLQSMWRVLNQLEPEKEIPLRLRRGDQTKELKITPAKR
ncbi:MAG: M28 family peptidase [Verrucomicrobiota bacterium]